MAPVPAAGMMIAVEFVKVALAPQGVTEALAVGLAEAVAEAVGVGVGVRVAEGEGLGVGDGAPVRRFKPILSLKLLPGAASKKAVPVGIARKNEPLRIGFSVSKLRLALVVFV